MIVLSLPWDSYTLNSIFRSIFLEGHRQVEFELESLIRILRDWKILHEEYFKGLKELGVMMTGMR